MKRILLISFVLMSALISEAWAQRTVTGTVISGADGEGLPGVAVRAKGTTTGVTTDFNGNYRLEVPEGSNVLVFSFVGFITQEVEIGNRSVVNVTLAEDVKQLEEVVVTAFGLEREQKALGYSVQSVGGEDLVKARETNVVNSLSGKVAGAQVTNSSGAIGSSARIVLRGASSLTGNNQPLFVVDGVPISNGGTGNVGPYGGADYGNGASEINPDDIESMTVLKGPNAAALYGSRAANGVILIKTKSGKNAKGLGISVNSTATVENALVVPDWQNSYGQGDNMFFFEYADGATGSGDGVDESWGMPLDRGFEAVQWNSFDANGEPLPWISRPNNFREFLETGRTLSNNVSLSGGNEEGNFRLSLTNLDAKGILPNTDLTRNTVATNGGYNLSEKLRADVSINYVQSLSDNRPDQGYTAQNPVQQFIWSGRNVDYAALKDLNNLPIIDPNCSDCIGAGIAPINWNTRYQNNPFWSALNSLNTQDKDRLFGNLRLTYQLTDYLSVFARTGTDYYSEAQRTIRAAGIDGSPNGYYREINRTFSETNSDFLVSFNKDFNEFSLGLNVGANRMDQKYRWVRGIAPELEIPGVYNLGNVRSGVNVTTGNYREAKRINSVYASGQFGWRNFLFLDWTARNDWSSTLPAEENSYFYPSATLSAVISDIVAFPRQVSLLKVRGGWAQVGNDTDPYQLIQSVNFRNPFGSVLEAEERNQLLNPALRPEITTSVELGMDARFFNNRLGLDLTYYDARSRDIIVPIQISSASGYTSRTANIGEMSNKGVEVQLSIAPIRTADFNWDILVNFARNRNRVESLAEGLDQLTLGGQWNVSIQARPGEPYGVIFGPGYQKDDEGNIVHKDGVPLIDQTYRELGNVTPDFNAGISNNLSYKGINLNFLIDGRKGGDIYSMTTTWGRYAGVLEETLLGRENGVVGVGVKNIGSEESPNYVENDVVVSGKKYNHAAYLHTVAEGSVFDGSFIKLRQVQLGYTIPNSLLGKLPFRDITISAVGRNLAFLYKTIPHIDPETSFGNGNAQGLEFGQIPSTRSYGVNLSFKL